MFHDGLSQLIQPLFRQSADRDAWRPRHCRHRRWQIALVVEEKCRWMVFYKSLVQLGPWLAESKIRRMRSADVSFSRVKSIPACSRGCSPWRIPAVSQSSTGQPSNAATAVKASRVVPGDGWTIALGYPSRALIRLLLPAFGGPAKTIRHGSVRRRPSTARERSLSICPAALATLPWTRARSISSRACRRAPWY